MTLTFLSAITFVLLLKYSRSETDLSSTAEKPARQSKSTPELTSQTRAASISTTSMASEPSFTSTRSTDDTLSMITTPWTTESWLTDSSCEEDISWAQRIVSSSSPTPKSSTSYGISTILDSFSETTLTLYGFQENDRESQCIHPLSKKSASGLSSTFSSWTVESFTSSGWLSDLSSKLVKVNYPWSPFTETTYSETYPSSCASSRLSLQSTITVSSKGTDLLARSEATNGRHIVSVT